MGNYDDETIGTEEDNTFGTYTNIFNNTISNNVYCIDRYNYFYK